MIREQLEETKLETREEVKESKKIKLENNKKKQNWKREKKLKNEKIKLENNWKKQH